MQHLPKRLSQQIDFICEIDKLKSVIRRSFLLNQERTENSAEHSWDVTIMALILAEYANTPVDISRVMKMLLIHDLVEIDAGDTFVYDKHDPQIKFQSEQSAAQRIFQLLPDEQAQPLLDLWHEFEAATTAEAKFAKAIDRFTTLIHNYFTAGKSWRTNNVTQEQVIALYQKALEPGSIRLWQYAQHIIQEAGEKGYFGKGTIAA